MKIKLTFLALLAALATVAQATLVTWDSSPTLNQAIYDGNPAGTVAQHVFTGSASGDITAVDVRLSISGGFNGNLYGYLVFQSTDNSITTAILLNQIGTSPTDVFGSASSGLSSITLSDSGMMNGNIHNATGVPTGIWQAGQYAGVTALNSTFAGHGSADGTWTLFLADLVTGGGDATLVSWGLDITLGIVPEPTTWALIIFGSLVGMVAVVGRRRRHAA